MSTTLFFVFEPGIKQDFPFNDALLDRVLYKDISHYLLAEEGKKLRSFVNDVSYTEGAEFNPPVFPVNEAINTLAEILMRLKSKKNRAAAEDAIIEELGKIKSGLDIVNKPGQMFYIGIV